jgi:hypothetical protein
LAAADWEGVEMGEAGWAAAGWAAAGWAAAGWAAAGWAAAGCTTRSCAWLKLSATAQGWPHETLE